MSNNLHGVVHDSIEWVVKTRPSDVNDTALVPQAYAYVTGCYLASPVWQPFHARCCAEGSAARGHQSYWTSYLTKSDCLLVALANHGLNFALVRWVDLVPVLWSHQHGSVLEGGALHLCSLALYNCGGQNGNHMLGEACDVACNPHQHPGCPLATKSMYQSVCLVLGNPQGDQQPTSGSRCKLETHTRTQHLCTCLIMFCADVLMLG